MNKPVKSKPRWSQRLWLIYFFLSIGVVGGLMAYFLAVPLYVIGYFSKASAKLGDHVMQKGVRFLLDIQPWLKLQMDPRLAVKLANGGCLFVSNHRSALDSYLILAGIPGVRILAKHSLFLNPLIGPIMFASRQIYARSKDPASFMKAIDQARTYLERGESVHIFPELTRCPTGFVGLQDFSAAPFLIASQAQVPIFPVLIKGSDDVWPRGIMGLISGPKVTVQVLEPIETKPGSRATDLRKLAYDRLDLALRE